MGESLRRANVSTIYLVHGTFVGEDALGLFREVGRLIPGFADLLRRLGKQTFDTLAHEHGNYTAALAEEFQQAIACEQGPEIWVERFHWSGENHHAGRAEAAAKLIEHLLDAQQKRPGRCLLWGHSHAGNVFALMTNLLGGDTACRDRFFEAAVHLNLIRHASHGKLPLGQHLAERLDDPTCRELAAALDLVTFGTPIRYGWDTAGYARLLHFVNHRPQADLPTGQVPFPPGVDAILSAQSGDYLQQLAVAGTNIAPSIFTWALWRADRRLQRLVQAGIRRRDLLQRWRTGQRAPDEGTTLLVDYGPAVGSPRQHLFGHGVYTQRDQLLFHAEEVARHFYGLGESVKDRNTEDE